MSRRIPGRPLFEVCGAGLIAGVRALLTPSLKLVEEPFAAENVV
jgi:hypothetical protein